MLPFSPAFFTFLSPTPKYPKPIPHALYAEIQDTHSMKMEQNNVRKNVALRCVSVTTVVVGKQ